MIPRLKYHNKDYEIEQQTDVCFLIADVIILCSYMRTLSLKTRDNVDLKNFFFYAAGEDGQVKVWSRSGMLRSTLVSLGKFSSLREYCTV